MQTVARRLWLLEVQRSYGSRVLARGKGPAVHGGLLCCWCLGRACPRRNRVLGMKMQLGHARATGPQLVLGHARLGLDLWTSFVACKWVGPDLLLGP